MVVVLMYIHAGEAPLACARAGLDQAPNDWLVPSMMRWAVSVNSSAPEHYCAFAFHHSREMGVGRCWQATIHRRAEAETSFERAMESRDITLSKSLACHTMLACQQAPQNETRETQQRGGAR